MKRGFGMHIPEETSQLSCVSAFAEVFSPRICQLESKFNNMLPGDNGSNPYNHHVLKPDCVTSVWLQMLREELDATTHTHSVSSYRYVVSPCVAAAPGYNSSRLFLLREFCASCLLVLLVQFATPQVALAACNCQGFVVQWCNQLAIQCAYYM